MAKVNLTKEEILWLLESFELDRKAKVFKNLKKNTIAFSVCKKLFKSLDKLKLEDGNSSQH